MASDNDWVDVPVKASEDGWEDVPVKLDRPQSYDNPEHRPITEKIIRGIPALMTEGSIGESAWGGGLMNKAGAATAAGLASITTDRDKKWGEIYDSMIEQEQKRKDKAKKENPGVEGTRDVLGSLVNPLPAAGKIGAGLAGKVSPVIAKYLGIGSEMAASAGGNYLDTLERTRNADEAGSVGKSTLALDAGMRAAPAIIGGIAKGSARLMSGLKDETMSAYRARPDAINATDMDKLIESGQATAREAYADQVAKRQELARFTKDQEEEIIKGSRKASGEAFEPLMASEKEINMSPIKGNLTQDINQAKFGDALRQSPGVTAMQKERDFLEQTGLKSMRPEEVKRYVMQLDKSLEPAFDKMKMGIPLDEGEKALIAHRKFINSKLIEIPEYDKAMGPVRDRMRVLGEVQPHIGDVDQTYKTLERLDNPAMTQAKAGLEGMFPWQSAARSIPEEATAINTMNKDLRGVNENNMEPFLKRMTRVNQSSKDREAFGGLASRAKDMPESTVPIRDMEQYLKDLNIKEAFEKPYVKGSRNVNLGRSIGGMIASVGQKVSNEAGAIGHGIGAVMGGVADLMGPQVVKRVIDVVDSPAGKKFADVYRKAAERGPQAIVMTHELLKQNDPEYRKMINEGDGQ